VRTSADGRWQNRMEMGAMGQTHFGRIAQARLCRNRLSRVKRQNNETPNRIHFSYFAKALS
jgi:hypothetical protein